ncbi:MAG TPA: hypothetical protein VJ873_06425 [bacterium]|nr:hypothetical protein [bacterium]
MKKISPSSPMFDIYSWVWKSCRSLWPLFMVQFLFLILQYVTLFICLGVLFGPFLAHNMDQFTEGMKDPQNYDWTSVASSLAATFTDPTWIAIAIGMILLYTTWWCILSALSDGGVYRTFWDYFEDGKAFDWGVFFKAAFHWMVPMLWLQFFLSLWFLGVLLIWMLVAGVAFGIVALTGFNVWVGVILGVVIGIPSFLFWIVFAMAFTVFTFLSKAYLVKGMKAQEAIRTAFAKARADHWRVGLGLFVAFLIYVGVSFFLRMGLQVLTLLPIIGFLFSMVDMVVGIGLIILMVIYMSGLSVAYLQDEAKV